MCGKSSDRIYSKNRTIGHRIKLLRIDRGLSRFEFSKSVFIRRDTLARIEIGKTYPRPATIQHICNFLKVRPEALIEGLLLEV